MRPLNSLLSSSKRLAPAVALIAALVALAAGSAYAYFTTTVASGGNGGSISGSLPQGNTPSVSLSGANVTVSFTQSTVGGQRLGAYAGGGYTVKRYPASGGGGVTPGTSCNTTISGSSEKLSCTESNVPPGSWKYTVTPVLSNWVGAESAQSAAVYRSSIALSPSSGGAGTGDSISGSGFAPNSTITATFGGSSVTLGGTTKTDGSGSFTGATYIVPADAAGSYEVVVSDGSSHSASASYQVTFGPASQIVLSGSIENLTSGNGRTYTAKIEDAAGNTVTGGPDATDGVTFSKTAGSGSVNGLATVAASEGVARDTVTGNKAGSVTIGAGGTVNGGATNSNTLSFEVVAGAPATVAVQSGSPQSSTVKISFASALVALVTDANGNPVSGVSVTFTAPSSGASGTFANTTTTTTATTASNGQATASAFTANTVAGGYTVSASVSGVSGTASFSLTNTAKTTNDTMSITQGNNQSTTVNTAFGTALKVKVIDEFNNPVSGMTVTFTAPSSGASGTFANGTRTTTATTDSTGVATASTYTANTTVGGYDITTSASGVASPSSFVVANTTSGPLLTLTPNSGHAAATIVLSGTGWTHSSTLTATFNGSAVTLTNGTTGNEGHISASCTFTVPSLATGTYLVVVKDGAGKVQAQTFTIT
jgi:hypothetical protein